MRVFQDRKTSQEKVHVEEEQNNNANPEERTDMSNIY